jgi:transcriptional regulator with XRE-family HTH domain
LLAAEQLRAARALLRWDQKTLATAAGISVETVKRLEGMSGPVSAHSVTVDVLQKALEAAGVEFITENGGGPGVRLKKRQRPIRK